MNERSSRSFIDDNGDTDGAWRLKDYLLVSQAHLVHLSVPTDPLLILL